MLLLCVVHELSTRDAAAALGIPEGTVKSRLSRAKARLRSELREWAPGRHFAATLSAPPQTADPEPARTRFRPSTAEARSPGR
ncbi:RNA polymerase sigma factor [Microbacterium oleivorans]|uniref:RNA polymerase sigma factor n=1 Tax=Microbacterium oleivorans TaxID=273677 RepID=UPI002115FA7F|nr:sigma factor-like helix-turn-helix DNA-binding protein [Microbacterium oleivorans]